ncbi:hypothetical protein GCM10023185_33060 [Hymenobacter saemangeumensis]|uniref:Uncharacterized protein n=1 Tax=Hymenobacter saemangeumensis TaxID=1084522 RepID=A0ABP8IN46_9BACT
MLERAPHAVELVDVERVANVMETDNSLSLELAPEVAPFFRLKPDRAAEVEGRVKSAVQHWRTQASAYGINRGEQKAMASAFAQVED